MSLFCRVVWKRGTSLQGSLSMQPLSRHLQGRGNEWFLLFIGLDFTSTQSKDLTWLRNLHMLD